VTVSSGSEQGPLQSFAEEFCRKRDGGGIFADDFLEKKKFREIFHGLWPHGRQKRQCAARKATECTPDYY
jgi:hypothetical protein